MNSACRLQDKRINLKRAYYANILIRLKKVIQEKRRGKLGGSILLLQENQPALKAHIVPF